jgi:hypothetical protein
VAVERHAGASASLTQQVSLRMAFRLVRAFSLITVTALVVKGDSKTEGLTTLLVLSGAFSIQLVILLAARRSA